MNQTLLVCSLFPYKSKSWCPFLNRKMLSGCPRPSSTAPATQQQAFSRHPLRLHCHLSPAWCWMHHPCWTLVQWTRRRQSQQGRSQSRAPQRRSRQPAGPAGPACTTSVAEPSSFPSRQRLTVRSARASQPAPDHSVGGCLRGCSYRQIVL